MESVDDLIINGHNLDAIDWNPASFYPRLDALKVAAILAMVAPVSPPTAEAPRRWPVGTWRLTESGSAVYGGLVVTE